MKTMLKFFTLTAVLFGFATISYAQNTDNATASPGATIISALKITKVKDLHFGTIAATSSSQTAIIAAEDGGDRTGGAAYVGSTYTIGEFLIEGENNQTVNFTVDASTELKSDTNKTMNITFDRSIAGNSFSLDASGEKTMYVGGTLTVGAGQDSGEYTGTYKVTVNYN